MYVVARQATAGARSSARVLQGPLFAQRKQPYPGQADVDVGRTVENPS